MAKGLQIGYFARRRLEALDPDEHAFFDVMKRRAPLVREQQLRDHLGNPAFRVDAKVYTLIGVLAGGERARLASSLDTVWDKPNLIVFLDEPNRSPTWPPVEALTVALSIV